MQHATISQGAVRGGAQAEATAPPRSVCILRLSALGDVTHVLPSVHALRDAWPDATITWIIGRKEHELLRGLPGVEFIVFDKRGGWRAIRDLRARGKLSASIHTVVICPSSSHALRNWRPERYAEVADYAAHFFRFRIVLAGGPGAAERALAEAIRSHVRMELLDLTGQAGLSELLALIEQASVVLAPDTGPVQLARALGTPVIGLFAATDSRRSGPYRDQRFCVDRFGDAALARRARAPGQLRWGARIEEPGVMDLISSADVIEALQRLARERGWAPSCVPASLARTVG